MTSMKATNLLQQENKTNDKRLSFATLGLKLKYIKLDQIKSNQIKLN